MDIIGHKRILEFLEKSLDRGKVSHAYLFYGPENVGKKLVAEHFARLLLNFKDRKNANLSLHQDFAKISLLPDKKNISIDQIRDLQKQLASRPFLASFKVAIIDEAEKMTLEAANSFLKFLEEPPPCVVLILVASNLRNIPPTIVSRCQLIRFNPVSLKEVEEFVIKSYNFSQEEAWRLAKISFGRPGLLMKLLDKEQFSAFKTEAKNFLTLLNKDFFEKLSLINGNSNPSLLIWEMAVRDILISHYGLSPDLFFCVSEIKKNAAGIPPEVLVNFLENLLLIKRYFNVNINKRLVLENLLLNI